MTEIQIERRIVAPSLEVWRALSTARGLALWQADEVFLSSSGGGVIPVAQVDRRSFGNRAAGPVARALRADYFKALERPALRRDIDYF